MGRYKTLVNNTLIFGICNFTSKLLVFFMLPLYTAVLSKEEFGTADLITTTVGLLYPILSLEISEACMRYALDKSYNEKHVFSIGLKVLLLGFILLLILTPIIINIGGLKGWAFYFVVLYATTVLNTFLNKFGRGIQKIKVVGIAGVASSFTAVGSNLLFLLLLNWGIQGYLISMILGHLVACAVLIFGGGMYRYITTSTRNGLAQEMIKYSIPMVPNKLSWWTNHLANRYILNYYCGVGDVGLYSAAARMPAIIDTFRGIFIEAWQLSMITEYNQNDSDAFFQRVYRVYNVFMIVLTTFLISCSQIIGSVLYSKEFYEAWIYTPLLLLGVFYGSMVAYYSPVYLAYKKTNKLFLFTLSGALLTLLINFILVPIIKINGAAIAFVVSNFIIYFTMEIDSRKYIMIENKDLKIKLCYFILTTQAFLTSFSVIKPFGLVSITIVLFFIIILRRDISSLSNVLKKAITNRIQNKQH